MKFSLLSSSESRKHMPSWILLIFLDLLVRYLFTCTSYPLRRIIMENWVYCVLLSRTQKYVFWSCIFFIFFNKEAGGLLVYIFQWALTIVLLKLLTANMHLYSEAHVIYGDYAHDMWNPDLVTSVLSQLTPDNMRVDLLLHHFNRTAAGIYSVQLTQ